MEMTTAIRTVSERRNLTGDEMRAVMRIIMSGEATSAQIGGFLIALRMKGETVEEIAAATTVMRELATPVTVAGDYLVDTCGTGGDGAHTFNISTTSAFIVAAAGGRVCKHGNRSVSSTSGSADLLERAGVNLNLTPEQIAHSIDSIGVGFIFAPNHHGAMKHAIGPRREMGVRTIFNLLGPLTNPAGATNQLIGVFDSTLVEPLARVLLQLGSRHVMVVHAEDGLDEISIASPTCVGELKSGAVINYKITPEQFGLKTGSIADITVDSVDASLAMVNAVLAGEHGAARDIVLMNAGAAIYVAGLCTNLSEGIERAKRVIDNGAAATVMAELVSLSQSYAA
ncbi:MAG: anthranilate phosphoribosyltransferase [Gammaproteobacteria bacterium]|nr:anthranilate phosphoribosyltransferase [Gammaproteobacteria bacterium]